MADFSFSMLVLAVLKAFLQVDDKESGCFLQTIGTILLDREDLFTNHHKLPFLMQK